MDLSIVELATVAPGTVVSDALTDAVETARHADRLGFARVWFAEHHGTGSQASHHPELLIAAVGTQTSGIRVGSGSVLLNHYSPFKVAEMFAQLEAMYPGRVDLGLGRATGGPVIDMALRRDRSSRPVDDHSQQVSEVLAWLYDAFPDEHPFAETRIVPGAHSRPLPWLLGSSPGGSVLAAELGMGYTFAGFINPTGAADALRDYRNRFAPRWPGRDQPHSILAVNVTVGDDDAEADHLVGSAKGFYARLGVHGASATVPTAADAARELTVGQRAEPTTIVQGRWPRFVAGGPKRVRATLDAMIEASGADELMIQNLIADPADRRRSHELLAELFDLRPRRDENRSLTSASVAGR